MLKKINLIFIIFLLYNSFCSANEGEDEKIEIEDVKKIGRYSAIEYFPEGMIKQFGFCEEIECKSRMAGIKVHFRFVKKKNSSKKYPGKVMTAMAWYEVFFSGKHKEADKFIERYLDNYPNDYKYKERDENKIKSLLRINKARESMRSALGIKIEEKAEVAINRFWLLGEFLNKGKPKKRSIEKDLVKRKIIIQEYRSRINKLREKIEEENE